APHRHRTRPERRLPHPRLRRLDRTPRGARYPGMPREHAAGDPRASADRGERGHRRTPGRPPRPHPHARPAGQALGDADRRRPLMALLLEAARAALADAGLAARDVDGIIAPGTTYAELHELARELGLRRQFFTAAGYSGGAAVASAPLLAALAIEAGLATAVL